ncbi:hypothetical protein GCM10025876_32140 [Demequina litorisediminis]|uniref:Uncharacterized protein n=1 Tax=Demequina litorisediminis TaxID=1849022 RepID=A0ABQ6IGT8_9MICO|nr:hypothetical protein GCM10025876_32140 [Demequina litorisediminis]
MRWCASLACEGGLTGTLEAGEHDDRGAGLREVEATSLATEDRHEFLVDDLDHLLAGVQCTRDLLAERALPDVAGERADHGHRDVGVEQGAADLADGGVDVRLGQAALAPQVAERRREAVGEVGEHRCPFEKRAGSRLPGLRITHPPAADGRMYGRKTGERASGSAASLSP